MALSVSTVPNDKQSNPSLVYLERYYLERTFHLSYGHQRDMRNRKDSLSVFLSEAPQWLKNSYSWRVFFLVLFVDNASDCFINMFREHSNIWGKKRQKNQKGKKRQFIF